jgi:hypothetical protein
MDFKDFINQIKELADPAVFAIIAKLAIAFYLGKKFIQFLITGFNYAYKEKEKQKEYIELKKDVVDLKKDNLENKERDLKTHEILKELQGDVNAYKTRTHKIETENIALIKTLEKNTDLMEKINNKL